MLVSGGRVSTADQFERFVRALSGPHFAAYRELATPRVHVRGHVYTSTEYRADQRIYLHNENSHVTSWPGRLYFWCERPASKGGGTPLADCRRVLDRISPETRARFDEAGWLYRRNFGFGMGVPWRTAFGVDTREEFEAYCSANHMRAAWIGDSRLRVTYRRWAVLRHPTTGQPTWFNHGLFFNPWNLTPEQQLFAEELGIDALPYDTYVGDGTAVPAEILAELRAAYDAETRQVEWQAGDVLIVDNMLVAHGREAYEGDRRILVAMTNPVHCEDVADPSSYRVSHLPPPA